MRHLIEQALQARENAYCPYSGFSVGAALETTHGKIYTGCNIENSAYTPTNCAERTAFFKAISEGVRDFRRIVIVAGEGGKLVPPVPCGVCLQVMYEFCQPDSFEIVLATSPDTYKTYYLQDLLPKGFRL